MESEKKFIDSLHIEIHALRLIPKYSPSEFERRLALKISNRYSEICNDCKEAEIRIKNNPKQDGFMDKLGGLLK